MECNRDEALRAKEVAEQKFNAKDIVGAKKFALKAQNLFPELEGINQMIATMDVYLAAEVKINGESDWYSVLCVNASADDDTVKKQYRKLALQHHPDKNKSIGSEGAFKLISQAWSVLSDKTRKMMYDQKRNTKSVQRKAHPKRDNSDSGVVNGFFNFSNDVSQLKTRKKKGAAARSAAATSSCPSNPTTFWTSCNRCRMQYEYLRVYLNHNLLCPNCHEAFMAIETGFPSNRPNSSSSAPHPPRQKSNHNSTMNNAYSHGKDHSTVQGATNMSFQHGDNLDPYDDPNFQHGAYSRTAGAASASASTSAAAQAANLVHQTYEKVRREREEAQATAKREEVLQKKNHVSKTNMPGRPPKRSRSMGVDIGTYFRGKETEASGYKVPPAEQHINFSTGYGMPGTNCGFVDPDSTRMKIKQYILSREFAQIDLRNILTEKAKSSISKKLKEWDSAAAAKLAEENEEKQKQKRNDNFVENAEFKVDGVASDQTMLNDPRKDSKHFSVKKISNNSTGLVKEAVQHVTIDVPDPDFVEFDKDRSEKCFEGEQVWATYDNEDGMPRFYALVQKVISMKPFRIRMCFLTSKSNSELGPLNWVASGYAKTCGDFRISRYEISETVNIFSHRVKGERVSRGVIRIVPRKGDTWALYRNWSPDWNEHTPDDMVYKYDMVEVLDDYSDEQGVSVTPLVKVTGFKTVFHRHMDPKEVKRIPREEMFRFSHQVPSHLLTGEEAHNAPKGCRELDPAATPLELLQVITEVKEDDAMETDEQQHIS